MSKRTPPKGANGRFCSIHSNRSKYISEPKPEPTPEYTETDNSNLTGGLSWVEFHRLANRVFDALDPYTGKGHLYTFEEVERSCEARSILAEELASLLGKNTITDQTIAKANRVSRGRVLKFNRNRKVKGKKRGED